MTRSSRRTPGPRQEAVAEAPDPDGSAPVRCNHFNTKDTKHTKGAQARRIIAQSRWDYPGAKRPFVSFVSFVFPIGSNEPRAAFTRFTCASS
jgi:hypothetical protein